MQGNLGRNLANGKNPLSLNPLTSPNKNVNTSQQRTLDSHLIKKTINPPNAKITTPPVLKSPSVASTKIPTNNRKSTSKNNTTSSKKRGRKTEEEEEEENEEERDDDADEEEEKEDFVEKYLHTKRQKTTIKKEKSTTDYSFLKKEYIKDISGHRPDDPNYDPSTLFISAADLSSMTDMESQYWKIKSKRFDCLLLFKKGKFYEMYERDADDAYKELGMKITHESRGAMRMCGFPEGQLNKYIEIFVSKGYKVAVADQLESSLDKEGKGIVKREVTAVYTPATFSPTDVFVQSKFLLCIKESGSHYGITIMHASIGEFTIGSFEDDEYKTQLSTLLHRLQPREILVDKTREGLSFEALKAIKKVYPPPVIHYIRPMDQLNSSVEAMNYLSILTTFQNERLKEEIEKFREDELALCSFVSVAKYLHGLEMADELFETGYFQQYDPAIFNKQYMMLDAQTLANLEICNNNYDGSRRGTLLELLDYTGTPFGKRKFVQWVQFPLRDVNTIQDRQNAIDDLRNNSLLERLVEELKYFRSFDLERSAQRIHTDSKKKKEAAFYTDNINKKKVLDFLRVIEGFTKLYSIFTEVITQEDRSSFTCNALKQITKMVSLEEFTVKKKQGIPDMSEILQDFQTKFDWDIARSEGYIYPSEGTNEQYDKLVKERLEWEQKIQRKLDEFKHVIKLPVSTFRSNSTQSELFFDIELSGKTREDVKRKLPEGYSTVEKGRKTILRVKSTELFALQKGLDLCELNIKKETRQNLKNLVLQFNEYKDCWRQYIHCISELECFMSLTQVVIKHQGMIKPVIQLRAPNERPFLELLGMRHPYIHCDHTFIENDTVLGGIDERAQHKPVFMIITGPNMGGKSTLMRQVCIAIIMAQLGCYVPANTMVFTPVDRIFTRIGASDKIMSGESTFMVELNETNNILRNATVDSLVILDELGRGTGTFDGYGIASAVGEYIANHIKCRTLFTTHYQMIHEEWQHNPYIDFYMMGTQKDGEQTVLTYKLIKGVAQSSHATACAKKAHLPNEILIQADKVAKDFEKYMQPAKEKLRKLALEISDETEDMILQICSILTDDSMEDEQVCDLLEMLRPKAIEIATKQPAFEEKK